MQSKEGHVNNYNNEAWQKRGRNQPPYLPAPTYSLWWKSHAYQTSWWCLSWRHRICMLNGTEWWRILFGGHGSPRWTSYRAIYGFYTTISRHRVGILVENLPLCSKSIYCAFYKLNPCVWASSPVEWTSPCQRQTITSRNQIATWAEKIGRLARATSSINTAVDTWSRNTRPAARRDNIMMLPPYAKVCNACGYTNA